MRSGVLGPALLALATAELGVRLLSPRQPAKQPASVDLHTYFTDEEIARGRRFARPQVRLALGRSAVEALALVALARRPPLRRAVGRWPAPAAGAGMGAALALALSVPPLPVSAMMRRRAIAVGLVTQPWRGWAADLVKSTAIETGLAAAGGGAVVALMQRFPRRWWLPAAGGSVLVGGVLAAVAPVVLDPLFNDFTPLPEGETRSDVLALARSAGVSVGEVYSIDASRRTTAANAYVTGIGPTKRVVLFDTLLDRYNRDEVRIVVAHELAHVRGRDVPRGLVFAATVAVPVALCVERLGRVLAPEWEGAAALPALALAAGAVSAPIGIISGRLSRALERRADDYSLELTGASEAFVSFERTIALQNVADLAPPWWVRKLLASHPSTTERIGAAVAHQAA